ncbi:MAG: LysR family transcriptional regulator [Pseudomonadota bacterium]
MRLTTIKALVAAIQEGSLRGAASRAGVSQPALSKMVRELELELGAPLLMRTSRGVAPTAQGQVLYEHAVKALRELGAAVSEIRQLDGEMGGEVHIGAVPMAVMLLVPETLRTFSQSYPEVRLRVSEELYVAQLQKLRAGEVDIMLGGVPHDLPPGEFTVEPLARTTMVPTARKGSPWLAAQCLEDLKEARWVYTGASAEEGYARQWFEAHGMAPPRVGAIVNSTLTLLSLVATGDCVALMPRQMAEQEAAKAFISIIEVRERGLELDIGAMVRSDVATTPLIRHLISHLHRSAHQLSKRSVSPQASV